MFERIFTLFCVVVSVMFFYSSSHGQSMIEPEIFLEERRSLDEDKNVCDSIEYLLHSSVQGPASVSDSIQEGTHFKGAQDAFDCFEPTQNYPHRESARND